MDESLIEGIDFIYNNAGDIELTPTYLIKQQKCCGTKCKHCPFRPRHIANSTRICCRHQAEFYQKLKNCNGSN